MLKVADIIAKDNNYLAIIKWDSLWQVSSQTLKNIFVIDKACETLVLRPLISFNKQEIVDISKKIWTYNFAINMPEYCWVISDKPSTWANLQDILDEEEKLDEDLVKNCIENKKIENIENVLIDESLNEIEIAYLPWDNEVIIDLREKENIAKNKLSFEKTEIFWIREDI